jgi:preprotein translocase subunit SecA
MSILDRALRVGEGKKFKEFERNVELINAFEPELELETDDELRERYSALRERYLDGESLDALLYESFALTREAGKRALGQRHFDVQLIGGMVLHDGSIAEMKTGEGKTLTGNPARGAERARGAGRERVRRQGHGRPPGHGERLPRPPRRHVDEADLRPARA